MKRREKSYLNEKRYGFFVKNHLFLLEKVIIHDKIVIVGNYMRWYIYTKEVIMKLVSFSITNFRSITKAHKIALGQYTVLLGKNNEGKSNISNALNIAMNILVTHSSKRRFYMGRVYEWSRDFPVHLQTRKSNVQSRFRMEFLLNEKELDEFRHTVGSKLNGSIVIEITIGKDNRPDIKVPKQGKNASVLTQKSDLVAKFISEKISVSYIPTVRTENAALREIRKVVSEHLDMLEENERYINAIQTVSELQQAVLDDIAQNVKSPLQEFMPKIRDVKLQIADERRRDSFHSGIDIIVDDGNPTNIEYKGDGIKSLAAIALLKESALKSTTPIIIIEEPESHLHPEAIDQLNVIIQGLAEKNQVIVTTHNPLFVIRNEISKNIIVNDGMAKPAKNLKEIRDVLGIKASDNLIDSKYTIIVEGKEDKETLKYILPKMSEKIGKALKSNILNIQEIGGASNLSYNLNLLKNMLYTYVVLLDDDAAGRKAYEKAEKDNLLKVKEITFTTCIGMKEAEFEDCINPNIYTERIKNDYNVDLSIMPDFKKNEKWSNRVKCSFKKAGKPWNDQIENEIKNVVVEEIKKRKDISKVFIQTKMDFLNALVSSIENMIIPN